MAEVTVPAKVVAGDLPRRFSEQAGWGDLEAVVDSALWPGALVCDLPRGVPDRLARPRVLASLLGVRVCEARLGTDPVFLILDPEQGASRMLLVAGLDPAEHFGLEVGDTFEVVLADPGSDMALAVTGLHRAASPAPILAADAWCGFCNTEAEVARLRCVPPAHLHADLAGKLARESADHWPSAATLRAFLPRIYEVLAPPVATFALFPSHPFEVLRHHQFASWPRAEREAVTAYWIAYAGWRRANEERDADEWAAALEEFLR